ncbi:helix-turn-helix DNA binding protein [Mycobacterium phage ThulaThula]|uniref:Helix-turn-helix DNA binding protein n=1 Tax=Mycobacterium phage ThulaThula TaxID=2599880 RepID=A0A5J6THC4_9CAUD|nr:helix-turn-helix DNA binding protein [Mycobacterium phage ThulaThula]QFG09099.1 helix-turn-helix DNA binding protein [Mycobacterium phage ThulaThula]
MTACQVCEGRAQLFLCLTHITQLRDTLRDLPWWLERLDEAVVGQVRLGDPGRRGTKSHELDAYSGPDGAEKLAQALRDGRFRRSAVLALGRVNPKASRLRDRAHNELVTWVRHLCETRGAPVPRDITTQGLARWLGKHVQAIAADEAAKECHNAVVDLTERIRRVVNRPEPTEYCGPCQHVFTDEQRTERIAASLEDRPECRVQLYAKRGARRVMCPECKTEHDVEALQEALLAEADEYSFSISDLSDFILPKLGMEIQRRTLQRWAKSGELVPSGFEANVARYQLAHVREVAGKKRRRNG